MERAKTIAAWAWLIFFFASTAFAIVFLLAKGDPVIRGVLVFTGVIVAVVSWPALAMKKRSLAVIQSKMSKRENLSDDARYAKYYVDAGLSKADVSRIYELIAAVPRVDPGRLRPDDILSIDLRFPQSRHFPYGGDLLNYSPTVLKGLRALHPKLGRDWPRCITLDELVRGLCWWIQKAEAPEGPEPPLPKYRETLPRGESRQLLARLLKEMLEKKRRGETSLGFYATYMASGGASVNDVPEIEGLANLCYIYIFEANFGAGWTDPPIAALEEILSGASEDLQRDSSPSDPRFENVVRFLEAPSTFKRLFTLLLGRAPWIAPAA